MNKDGFGESPLDRFHYMQGLYLEIIALNKTAGERKLTDAEQAKLDHLEKELKALEDEGKLGDLTSDIGTKTENMERDNN